MSTQTRKEADVQERELKLLSLARKMLIEDGYANFRMDRFIKVSEYGKGTVYAHFSNMEDLVAAMALQTMEQRTAMFAKAMTFQGRPRERFLALGVADELFGRLYPHHYRSELIIKMADLAERASVKRRVAIRDLEGGCLAGALSIVEDAVAQGDLTLSGGMTAGEIVYAVFAHVIGTQLTMFNFRTALQDLRIADPFASSQRNIQALLDGFGWRPLFADWDYDSTHTRIAREVFQDEWRRARLD
jgi:AcrR family transcriptional regulator